MRPHDDESILDLLDRLEPEIQRLFETTGVPQETIQQCVNDALEMMILRWDQVTDRAAWLREVLERKCQELQECQDHELRKQE